MNVRIRDESRSGAVVRRRGEDDDDVAEREIRREPAARADAQELRHAEPHELLDDDRGRGRAHAGRLHRDRLALERPRVAEQSALGVRLADVREERLCDGACTERVAGKEAGLRVVAGLGSNVDRHARTLLGRRLPILAPACSSRTTRPGS